MDYERWQTEGQGYDDLAPWNAGDDDYGDEWPDEPEYDDWYTYPTWRDKLIANVRFAIHMLRMRVDKKYAERINDIPF